MSTQPLSSCETLRERGWQIVADTLNGLKAHRDGRTIGWREALGQTEREGPEVCARFGL